MQKQNKILRCHRISIILISFLFTIFGLNTVQASEHVEAKLVSEVTSIKPGQAFWVAVSLKMEPYWHTYWANAGEAGSPTNIEWELPEGFKASSIHWPTPKRFESSNLVNYGYEDTVLLLVEITPSEKVSMKKPITLKAKVSWLECSDMCIPSEEEMQLVLPVSDTSPTFNSKWYKQFKIAKQSLPKQFPEWKVTEITHNGELGLLIQSDNAALKKSVKDVFFFAEEPSINPSGKQALTPLLAGYFLKLEPNGEIPQHLKGVLYNAEGWIPGTESQGMLVDVELQKTPTALLAGNTINLETALGFAFLGGLILNLMPCVFPILSIKILGFVKKAGNESSKIKMHGVAFALGVLVSFLALSGLLLLLRAGGESIGWGFQLQSPYFIAVLAFLLTLLALNFAGVFEIGTSLISAGGNLGKGMSYSGTFISGILATVLATPCTAPYMGTALGFALAGPPVYALGIFTSLAIGMATPYLVLSFNPRLLKFVPKPGPWMDSFKQAMAFPLVATVLWLLWIFVKQTSSDGLIILLFGLLFTSFAAWVYGHFAAFSTQRKRRIAAIIASLIFLGLGVRFGHKAAASMHSTDSTLVGVENLNWEPFSHKRLAELRKEGKPVYIDFTAAWCLTCQTNKSNIFSSGKVIQALKDKNITLLKADWTRKDPEITKALEAYGRSGVPTNVFYPASVASDHIVLPELLTPGIVLQELEKS